MDMPICYLDGQLIACLYLLHASDNGLISISAHNCITTSNCEQGAKGVQTQHYAPQALVME